MQKKLLASQDISTYQVRCCHPAEGRDKLESPPAAHKSAHRLQTAYLKLGSVLLNI